MTSKSSRQQKGSSWVMSTFDDVEVLASTSRSESRVKKRQRQIDGLARLGKKRHQQFQCGTDLWVDRYAPLSREDLAVHKKKVQEVETWLVESMSGMKDRKFLLLTGPSGCGKSATLKILSREAKLNLIEWINPTTAPYKSHFMGQENTWIPGDTVRPVSQTTQFWEFLVRTSKYSSVCVQGRGGGNLVCVEDLPNVFTRDPSSLHNMLREYNKRSNSSPVVFIVTDSTQQSSSAKHLLPPDLQQELSFVNIVFNPIASGLMVKALSRVVSLEGSRTTTPLPTKEALTSLANTSGGDVRSAINALQFATKKDVYGLEVLFTESSRQGKKSVSRSKSISRTLSNKSGSSQPGVDRTENQVAIGGKDGSLFLFRALGKVLYCKRNKEKGITEPLPKHLHTQERPPLQENPENIYDKTSMGAASFSLFLHQNCLAFFSDIESVAEALTHLTHGDVLMAEWLDRQVLEDYAASVTVRGMMHANENMSSGGGWRPFLRPQWYSVIRDSQQNTCLLKSEHRMEPLTSEELTTVLAPMKAKILQGEKKANTSPTFRIGLFDEVQRQTRCERLGELDVNTSIVEEEEQERLGAAGGGSKLHTLSTPQQFNTQDSLSDPEEDFRIDDSDEENT
ncbi:hypothetical protein Pcinc_025230 [Petrolisthes cinctipes]|uniref:Cell cycle checkpoint protein RAD17 n=1 Tax=Petrolisthes cinctipes TaxID=88211 RepID=A0AAE1F977_PETCI|nr:hypothetical protein Pcinc_025230 [Petrolisthes cinctipes]